MSGITVDGFSLRVFSDDHAPAHVHVFRYGAELRIFLDSDRPPERVSGRMTVSDEKRARRHVAENREQLLIFWRRYHG